MSDLLKHFIAGFIIGSVVMVVMLLILGTDKEASDWAVVAAFASGLLSGIGKEVWDYFNGGSVSVADVTLTWVGSIVPIIAWGVIMNFI